MAKSKHFLKTRQGLAITGVVSLGLAWLVWLRASDTGSLQQYALLIVLVIFGINRLAKAIKILI
jgi:hypothetical protein